MNSVRKGLILWFNYVLPALLPFMISINLLKETPFPLMLSKAIGPVVRKLFGLSSYGIFAAVSGFLSGYPIGAKLVSELYTDKKITKREAQYLLSFTNNSGPLFIIGTVGTGLLKNKSLGIFLLLVHYLSAIIIGLILQKPRGRISYIEKSKDFNIGKELKSSIYNGIESIVLVGGYIIFFSIICTILHKLLMPFNINKYIRGLIFGILEITNGCNALAYTNPLSISLISGIIAFGGFSIHSQSSAYIVSADLSVRKYILSKAFQGLIAFIISIALFPLWLQYFY